MAAEVCCKRVGTDNVGLLVHVLESCWLSFAAAFSGVCAFVSFEDNSKTHHRTNSQVDLYVVRTLQNTKGARRPSPPQKLNDISASECLLQLFPVILSVLACIL